MKKYTVFIFLSLILLIGGLLRNYHLMMWPREGATFDEFAWTFQGLSLLQRGIPTSWSPHRAYKDKIDYYNPQGAHFTLVTPYLEHPPLFGLIAGGFAKANGVSSFDEVTIQKIRPLALILGILSIYAVYLLSSKLYGDTTGLLSACLYAIIPTVVIGSRIVQNENFFIPLFLFLLHFAHQYTNKSSSGLLFITAALSAILPLAKMPWIVAPMAVIGIYIYSKKWKAALWVGGATAIGICSWLLYGFITDAAVFTNLWKLQLARYYMDFDSIFVLFRDPVIVDRAFADGWIYAGWATMFLLVSGDIKKHIPVIMGFAAYAAVFVFAIPSEPMHGWYRYPFYPFLAISSAVFIKEHLNKNYFVFALFLVVVGLSVLAGSWERAFGFSYPVLRTFLAAVAIGAMPGFFSKTHGRRIIQCCNILLFIGILLMSIWTVVLYNEQ